MTVTAGARPSKRQVVGSAQASARGADGPLPVASGGTGGTTAPEARVNLGVPGLGDDNVLSGSTTLAGPTTLGATQTVLSGTLLGGSVFPNHLYTPDGSEITSATTITRTYEFPDMSGVVAILGGPSSVAYVAKTTTYSASLADCVINATSGTWTLSLPAAATAGAGRLYIVKNSGAGTITLATTGGDTIDGALTQTLAPYNSITVVSTGSAWIIV